MSLELRNGIWRIRAMVGGKRIQQSTNTGDKKLAQRIHDKVIAEAVLGLHNMIKPDVPTLKEAYDSAIRSHYAHKKSKGTVRANYATLERLIGGSTSLAAIDEDTMDKLVETLTAEGLAPGTINRKLALLSKLLRLNERHLSRLPKIPLQEEYEGRIRYLTDEEELVILKAIAHRKDDPMWQLMERLVIVLLDTGMRLGEALALRWDSIDHENQTVHIWVSKGDKPRTIPLTKRAYSALRSQLGVVFEAFTKDRVEHRWKTIRKELRLEHDEGFVIHCLRHTCCTRLIKRGMNLHKVQLWMGHKDLKTTLRYVHLDTEDLRECRNVLEGSGPKADQKGPRQRGNTGGVD